MIKKIISLLKSAKNPNYFRYRLCHATRRYMNFMKAQKIAERNYKDYISDGLNDFVLPTYDGSNQSVHPDIISDGTNVYLAVTPYPYGMEEYENPCVYVGKDLSDFVSIEKSPAPISYPQVHRPGVHLSDPCLILQNGVLRCVFRESIREKDGEENILKYSENINGQWKEAKVIVSSMEDSLISPALLCCGNEIFMYHVKVLSQENQLVMSKLSENMEIVDLKPVNCSGIPNGYRVWHMSMYFDDYTKQNDSTHTMKGLFTLKNYDGKGEPFKLFYATGSIIDGDGWTLHNEIIICDKIKRTAKFVYKSCFVPYNGKILLSFRDKLDRYRLSQIDFAVGNNVEGGL